MPQRSEGLSASDLEELRQVTARPFATGEDFATTLGQPGGKPSPGVPREPSMSEWVPEP